MDFPLQVQPAIIVGSPRSSRRGGVADNAVRCGTGRGQAHVGTQQRPPLSASEGTRLLNRLNVLRFGANVQFFGGLVILSSGLAVLHAAWPPAGSSGKESPKAPILQQVARVSIPSSSSVQHWQTVARRESLSNWMPHGQVLESIQASSTVDQQQSQHIEILWVRAQLAHSELLLVRPHVRPHAHTPTRTHARNARRAALCLAALGRAAHTCIPFGIGLYSYPSMMVLHTFQLPAFTLKQLKPESGS